MGAMANGMAAHGGVMPLAVTYLRVLRLRAPGDAHGRADGAAGEVRVQPRLDRHRPATGRPTSRSRSWRRCARCRTCWCCVQPMRSRRPSAGRSRSSIARGPSTPGVRAPGAAARSTACTRRRTCRAAAPTCSPKPKAGRAKVTLLATGSEVALALAARDALQAGGIVDGRRVDAELGIVRAAGCRLSRERARPGHACASAVEAALRFGWDRWLGERGGFVGMTRLRRFRTGRSAVRALRHHARGHRRRGAPPARHPTRDGHRMSPRQAVRKSSRCAATSWPIASRCAPQCDPHAACGMGVRRSAAGIG